MAKSYRELTQDLARRSLSSVSDMANAVVDTAADVPAHIAEAAENVAHNMTSKAEVVATTIEAKIMMEDRLMDEIRDEEFAYRLVQDENLRKTMHLLTDQILNPEPENAIVPQKDGSFLNINGAMSTFWAEVQKKTPIEIEDASKIESILLNIEAAQDSDMAPDTRKLFLREAGLTAEQADEMIPLSEYIIYETKMMDVMREDAKDDLGLHGDRPLSEQEQLMVDSITEDKVYAGPAPRRKEAVRDKGYVRGTFDGQSIRMKDSWSGHTFTDEELIKLFAGESITIDFTDNRNQPKQITGKLEEQMYRGKSYFGFRGDYDTLQDQSKPDAEKVNASDKPHPAKRKGYVEGVFDGKTTSIKGAWSGHTFTDEELTKLFSGESVSFEYTNKKGQVKQVEGKLELQSYNGKEFMGFKPDFRNKQMNISMNDLLRPPVTGDTKGNSASQKDDGFVPVYSDPAINPFDESAGISDQAMYEMFASEPSGPSDQEIYEMFDQSAPVDTSSYEETYGISAPDMYTMFSNGDGHMPDPETWTDAPMDDHEWQQIMELSGAEENYQAMMNGSIDENMEMLAALEAQERARESDLMLQPGDLVFPPEEMNHGMDDVPDFGISDADLAFAEQYAHEDESSFGISDADLAFAEEMARAEQQQ